MNYVYPCIGDEYNYTKIILSEEDSMGLILQGYHDILVPVTGMTHDNLLKCTPF